MSHKSGFAKKGVTLLACSILALPVLFSIETAQAREQKSQSSYVPGKFAASQSSSRRSGKVDSDRKYKSRYHKNNNRRPSELGSSSKPGAGNSNSSNNSGGDNNSSRPESSGPNAGITPPVTPPASKPESETPVRPVIPEPENRPEASGSLPVVMNWHWQLTGRLNTGYDVHLYDVDLMDTSAATIRSLQQEGRTVICYFSAGSRETWRSDDKLFMPADIGKQMSGWAGENWLDIRSDNVRTIMVQRLDLAREKGCDGVEPDNVDGYSNATGFPLKKADQLDYNRYLARQAHQRGLLVALKNAVELVPDLVDDFDFAVNESCLKYNECNRVKPFIEAGKPVLHVEYDDKLARNDQERGQFCRDMRSIGFSSLVLPRDLNDQFRYSCSAALFN